MHIQRAERALATRTDSPANTDIRHMYLNAAAQTQNHTDTQRGTSGAADSQTLLLEAFLVRPLSAPRYLARITPRFPATA